MHEQSTSPSTVRRAVLYVRTGTVPEIAETDVEPLQAYAAQRGYQLVEIYRDEGVSGKELERRGLNRLLSDASAHRFDEVLVAHRSSFATILVDAQAVIDDIQRTGVAIESLADDIVTPQGDRPALAAAPPEPVEAVDPGQLRVGMTVLGANGNAIGTVK